MSRVEEFKLLRAYKRKCVMVLLLFLIITFTGVLVSDYCINSIVKNENKVEVLELKNEDNTTIKMNVLNNVIVLHLSGVLKDFDSLKKKLFEWSSVLKKTKNSI